MHPRSRNRARITPDTLRRQAAQPALHVVRPQTAFRVVAGTLAVIRPFEINWPFTGTSIAFVAGEEVHLAKPEDWIGGESIVIVVETRTIILDPAKPLGLTALPRRLANHGDTVVGGFDLAPDCAVLAGSMWDANLKSAAPTPAPEAVERMADIFIARQRDGFDDTTHHDLVREGVSESDIVAHYDAAVARAARMPRDRDVADAGASYDRQARVMRGANALVGELDPNRVHTTLRLAGLSTPEIGNLFDDIIGESMRMVREGHAALAGAH
ncbi:MAG TPA: hypothetical protein VGN60_00905 [Devosia sp.]|jgi:hypothetical protein|nr:hypothetical protein [Devosia sp.]